MSEKVMGFDDKAKVVAECWMIVRDAETWDEIVNYGDLGFPLAYAHLAELAELKEDGRKLVNDIYEIILKSLDLPEDKFYEDFEAVLDEKIALQGSDSE